MPVNLTKSPTLRAAQDAAFRRASIAETLADRDARQAFALATGMSLDFDFDRDGEKAARRARYQRKRGSLGRLKQEAR